MDTDKAPTEINGEKQIYSTKDKVSILGTASTMPETPWDDQEMEIWALSQCVVLDSFQRADILFELHTADLWKVWTNILPRLNATEGRIIMQQHYDNIPKSEKFPIETILSYKRYQRSSISYLLALAYHSFKMTGRPKHVSLYGIHMEDKGEEYGEQRPCCEYWLGRMEDAGQEIYIAGGSVLSAPFLYGYEEFSTLVVELRQRYDGLANGLKGAEDRVQEAINQKNRQDGAIGENEYWLRKAQRGELNGKPSS